MEKSQIAQLIDHTILKPEASAASIEQLCKEAIEYSFASVCVHPYHIATVAKNLQGHPSKACCVVGFPFGTNHSTIKALEAKQAIYDGADEIDMVISIPACIDGKMDYVRSDIKGVLDICHDKGTILKVILKCRN